MSSSNESITAVNAEIQAQQKAERDVAFATAADQRFQANMLAFRQYFPDICQTFVHYQPTDKFKMFVNENGTANIIDQDSHLPMYTTDPVSEINQQVKHSLNQPDMNQLDFTNVFKLANEGDYAHLDVIKAVVTQYDLASKNLAVNRKVDSHIPAQVIFGVGLGYHLMPLAQATTASYISIFEPNNDYFYASLFCFDWKTYLETVDASGSFLFIGIGDSEEAIYKDIYSRTREIGPISVVGAFFYLHYPSAAMERIVAKIKNQCQQLILGLGFFSNTPMV